MSEAKIVSEAKNMSEAKIIDENKECIKILNAFTRMVENEPKSDIRYEITLCGKSVKINNSNAEKCLVENISPGITRELKIKITECLVEYFFVENVGLEAIHIYNKDVFETMNRYINIIEEQNKKILSEI